MQITTVTQKGQATIPIEIRRKLKIKPGQKILFSEKGDSIMVHPVPDFFSLRGSIKTKKKYNKKAVHKAIGKLLSQRYVKTLRR